MEARPTGGPRGRAEEHETAVQPEHPPRTYEGATIHVILDNYGIHKSRLAQRALAELGCIVLHFLPPYSPELNRIERLFGEVHANVTRNHR